MIKDIVLSQSQGGENMREIFMSHPAALLLLAFFVLGLYVYQAASILMKGSIFIPLRNWIGVRAENSTFFSKIQEMLGCMLCTGTQTALWTIGIPATTLAFKNDFWRGLLGELAWYENVPLTLLSGFALSLAVASLARGYFQIVDYRAERFEQLQREHAAEVQRLRQVINTMQINSSCTAINELLPEDVFLGLHEEALQKSRCSHFHCRYLITACRMRNLSDGIRAWWKGWHQEAHLNTLETVIGIIEVHRSNDTSSFYMLFWPKSNVSGSEVYRELVDMAGQSLADMRASD